MSKIRAKALELEVKTLSKWNAFKEDVNGSETTEKIGMVLVAAVVIGLLVAGMRTAMPTMFDTLIKKASDMLGKLK